MSPLRIQGEDDGEATSRGGFAAAIPGSLKVSLFQLLSLHAISRGSVLEASLLAAQGESALQGLVGDGLATAPSSMLMSALARLSLSVMIEEGLSAIEEDRRKWATEGIKGTDAALEAFLSNQLTGRFFLPYRGEEVANGGREAPFRHRIADAPLSGCLDAMLAVSSFLRVFENQQGMSGNLEEGDVSSSLGDNATTLQVQQQQLPWRLRCYAAAHVARQLVRNAPGVRAATALLQDMLERQQQLQQQQVVHRWDLTLFSAVIRLKLHEISRHSAAISNAAAKAQQLLRLVQQETHHRRSLLAGRSPQVEQEDGGLLMALQLSCHCALLRELQRTSRVFPTGGSAEMMKAEEDATKSLHLMRGLLVASSSTETEWKGAEAAAETTGSSVGAVTERLKYLWRCATLAKEILTSMQEEAGEREQHEGRRNSSMPPAEGAGGLSCGGAGRKAVVVQLFCDLVVDLVATGGADSKYGRWGAAVIPSVFLFCADASRSCGELSAISGRSVGKDINEEAKGAEVATRAFSPGQLPYEGISPEEMPAALESRLTRLMAKIPVEVLRLYFPQLLGFVAVDSTGCFTKALLPRLHAVVVTDPHGAFHALEASLETHLTRKVL